MQFAPKEYNFGEDLGKQLGSGLTGSLSNLAQFKLKDIIRRQEANRFKEAVSKGRVEDYPEWAQKLYYEFNPRELFKPNTQQSNGLMNTSEIQTNISNQPDQQMKMMEEFGNLYNHQGPMNAQQEVMNTLQGQVGNNMPTMGEGARQLAAPPIPGQHRTSQTIQPQTPSYQFEPLLNRREQAALKIAEVKAHSKDLSDYNKYSQKRVDSIGEQRKAIKDSISRLNDVLGYSRSGELISGPAQAVLQKLGLENIINNAPTEATRKAAMAHIISTMSNMKGASRGTNLLLKNISQANISDLNSPEGIEAIIQPMILRQERELKAGKIEEDLRNKYFEMGRRAPMNINSIIDEKMEPYDKEMNNKIEDIAKRVIKSSRAPYELVSSNIDKLPDPKTFNTMKDGRMFTNNSTGKIYGSDGTRIHQVSKRGGKPIFID